MGDSGSQFLGFTLGFLAVLLTQDVNTALSPALPALLLGLPIVDILAVFAQRIYHGMNWFRATRNHIHHRLLALGFHHYEAVVIIYSIQMFFIVSAIFLCYESDILILSIYIATCALVFLFLILAERSGWRAHRRHGKSRFAFLVQSVIQHRFFVSGTTSAVAIFMAIMFLGSSVLANHVPRDLGISAGLLAITLLLVLMLGPKGSVILRAVSYVTAAFIVYLETKYISPGPASLHNAIIGLYVLLAISVWLSVRYASDSGFRTSPMDFLVIFVVLTVGIITQNQLHEELLGTMAVKIVILFYACELIFTKLRNRWTSLSVSTLVTLAILGVRSLMTW